MAVIGIDVGGHSIKAGIVTRTGRIVHKEVVLTEAELGRKRVVENIVKVLEDLMSMDKTVSAIGIGIPGVIDEKGYISSTPNLPLSKFDLGKELRKKVKKRFVFTNDADNFARAHLKFGAAKGLKTAITLTLGTGVGSGIIINGKIFENKGAPELGHTTINHDGIKARCCGNDGCIESYIGRRTFPGGPLDTYKKALAQDKLALAQFKTYGEYLGVAVANFVNIFNPDVVILGGAIANAYDFFKEPLKKQIKKRTIFKTKVVKNRLKDAGLLGAAICAF